MGKGRELFFTRQQNWQASEDPKVFPPFPSRLILQTWERRVEELGDYTQQFCDLLENPEGGSLGPILVVLFIKCGTQHPVFSSRMQLQFKDKRESFSQQSATTLVLKESGYIQSECLQIFAERTERETQITVLAIKGENSLELGEIP